MTTSSCTIDNKHALGSEIRTHFPFYSKRTAAGRIPAYLDSAATSQKPECVVKRVSDFLAFENANIHRGAYALSGEATLRYEEARAAVAKFISAESDASVVFTRGTTDSINLAANLLAPRIGKGGTILLTVLEHHSNIIPWELVAKRIGANLQFVDCVESGEIDRADFSKKVSQFKPRVVAFTQISNALGTVLPVKELTHEAHLAGALVLVDGAQSVPHQKVDVKDLGCDFFAFSGHKLFGPTGIGVLYGKEKILSSLEPYVGGGGMIATVSTTGSTWADSPQRFEPGTPPIAEALGLAAAIQFINSIGFGEISAHEESLFTTAWNTLTKEKGVRVYGPAASGGLQRGIISFTLDGIHPHDFASIADGFDVQIRAGHHCAMPLLKRLSLQSTARVSLSIYNTSEDISLLCEAIRFARKKFI